MIAFVSGLSENDPDAADADAFIDPFLDVRAGDPMNLVWRDRLARSKPTPTDRTVGFWIAKFLELRDVDVKAGELSRDGYDQCRWAMDAFKEWLAPSLPIDKLDSDRWVSWYKHVQSLENKAWTKKKLFSYPESGRDNRWPSGQDNRWCISLQEDRSVPLSGRGTERSAPDDQRRRRQPPVVRPILPVRSSDSSTVPKRSFFTASESRRLARVSTRP